jgi:hypothetical protein
MAGKLENDEKLEEPRENYGVWASKGELIKLKISFCLRFLFQLSKA